MLKCDPNARIMLGNGWSAILTKSRQLDRNLATNPIPVLIVATALLVS